MMIDIVSDPIGAPPQPATVVHPDVVFVLDESGSMAPHRSAVVSTFNEYVQSVKSAAKSVSLYTFDSTGIRERIFKENPARVKRLTEENYRPNAGTPLFDAMGAVINKFRYNGRPVQLFVHTDGEENASTEWTKPVLDELIAHQQAHHKWLFTYLMEGLQGRETFKDFSGLKMAFTPMTRSAVMGQAVNSTAMYAATMDSNPHSYTMSGRDEIDVDAGEALKSSSGGVAPASGTSAGNG